jgi:hypothetical protein
MDPPLLRGCDADTLVAGKTGSFDARRLPQALTRWTTAEEIGDSR